MKKYLKKVFLFFIIALVLYMFNHNIIFSFEKGFSIEFKLKVLQFIIIFIYTIVLAFIYIGILKYISKKIDSFIYSSNLMVIHLAISYEFSVVFNANILLGASTTCLSAFNNIIGSNFIELIIFVLFIIGYYYLWKYRAEITANFILFDMIFKFTDLGILDKTDFLNIFFQENLGIRVSNPLKGFIALAVFVGIVSFLIFLRKKGVYDWRSEKELIDEKYNKRYYKRFTN